MAPSLTDHILCPVPCLLQHGLPSAPSFCPRLCSPHPNLASSPTSAHANTVVDRESGQVEGAGGETGCSPPTLSGTDFCCWVSCLCAPGLGQRQGEQRPRHQAVSHPGEHRAQRAVVSTVFPVTRLISLGDIPQLPPPHTPAWARPSLRRPLKKLTQVLPPGTSRSRPGAPPSTGCIEETRAGL